MLAPREEYERQRRERPAWAPEPWTDWRYTRPSLVLPSIPSVIERIRRRNRKAKIRALGYTNRGTAINATGSGATTLVAGAVSTTAGDTVWGIVSDESATNTLNSVTSSTGDSATIIGPQSYATGSARTWFVYLIGITGNANDVWTATFANNANFGALCMTTTAGIGSFVTSAFGSGSSADHTAGPIATTNQYAYLACADTLFNNGDYRARDGWQKLVEGSTHTALHYRVQDRTGSYSSRTTCTVNDLWAQWLVEFAPDGGFAPEAVWTCGHSMSSATAPMTQSTITISIPYVGGEEDGDFELVHLVTKHANAPSPPAGWSLVASATDGTGTGVDSGEVRHYVYQHECDGTESGTAAFSKSTETGTMIAGMMFRFKGKHGTANVWSVASTTGVDSTTGTGVSIAGGADPGVQADDMLVGSLSDVSDVGSNNWTAKNMTQSGCTFRAPLDCSGINDGEIAIWGTTQGDDGRLAVFPYYVTSGTSSGAPTMTATAASSAGNSHRSAGVFTRLRVSTAAKASPPMMSPHPMFLLN